MDEKANKAPKRDRYWSIMLVGDHGRVIPFRHFKALAVGGFVALILSLATVAVIGFMYWHQRLTISDLKKDLGETRAQVAKFRDEKDLYLTQLMALKQQNGELPQKPSAEKETSEQIAQAAPKSDQKEKVEEVPKQVPVEKPAPVPQVKWSADVRQFKATYDNRQNILRAQFRIYNTSSPKKTLDGRTVVIFKQQDDTPIHWTTVPAVSLRDGKPTGKNGKPFKINNYRTEHFSTVRKKDAAEFDMASIFIFTDQGELIGNQEIAFNVDYSEPKPPAPVEPKPEAIQRETSGAGEVRGVDAPNQPEVKNIAPVPQSQSGVSPVQPSSTTSAPPSPESRDKPAVSDDNAEDTLNPSDTGDKPAPGSIESTIPTPAAEPKPVPEGGPKK